MKLQKLYRYVRQAADEYNLIEDGDKIAVAVSGGKDSLALLYALAGFRRFYPASFTLCAITVDIGFGMDFTPVQKLCEELRDRFFHAIENGNIEDWTAARTHMDVKQIHNQNQIQKGQKKRTEKTERTESECDSSGGEI